MTEWLQTILGGSVEWYVDRMAARIDDLYQQYGKLILVGHSAAGWIARICLGQYPYMGAVCVRLIHLQLKECVLGKACNRAEKVEKLIALGTPFFSIENFPYGRVKVRNT